MAGSVDLHGDKGPALCVLHDQIEVLPADAVGVLTRRDRVTGPHGVDH